MVTAIIPGEGKTLSVKEIGDILAELLRRCGATTTYLGGEYLLARPSSVRRFSVKRSQKTGIKLLTYQPSDSEMYFSYSVILSSEALAWSPLKNNSMNLNLISPLG